MAVLDRDAYNRKAEWAARRMVQNKEIKTLTEEQHDALAELCELRHNVHANWDTLFVGENCREIDAQICSSDDMELCAKIEELFGVKPFAGIDYPTSYIYDVMGYDSYDDAYESACDMFAELNNQIETFLLKIDKEHGTNYCPCGKGRFY